MISVSPRSEEPGRARRHLVRLPPRRRRQRARVLRMGRHGDGERRQRLVRRRRAHVVGELLARRAARQRRAEAHRVHRRAREAVPARRGVRDRQPRVCAAGGGGAAGLPRGAGRRTWSRTRSRRGPPRRARRPGTRCKTSERGTVRGAHATLTQARSASAPCRTRAAGPSSPRGRARRPGRPCRPPSGARAGRGRRCSPGPSSGRRWR